MPKSIVPDLEQFNGNRMKFKDQWRRIRLFFKSNRVTEMDNRMITILAQLRENIVDIYTKKKLDQLEEETDTQDWNEFVRKLS